MSPDRAGAGMSGAEEADPFEAFRREVFADPALQDRLLPLADIDAFCAEAAALARARGHALTTAEVAARLRAGQTTWLTPWLPIL
ncbi:MULTISPECIES: hypothetical protein [unclassified Methylobacterium]|uniref:hypothetical protein n=1 Tax=unclassified Methylobacterium TaxID=2615210 RepID=UPI0036F73704